MTSIRPVELEVKQRVVYMTMQVLSVTVYMTMQVSTVTMAQPQGHFGYQIVRIIKTSSLGVGSYGAVYRALCDELPCAAKILHPTLFQTNDPGTQKIMERFEQECQFLSGARHPHIVQYLGVSRDPESGLPVLLMELMDSNLTRFLEQSEEPLPFHTQVDICHGIALALAYLHSNGIIHRDLSSNNVLLIGPGNRAKVTDFGMSKLADANPRMTPMTMCPGTLAYMPPEALKDPPVYSKKLDCFSFGVLGVQITTRQFPNPGARFRMIDITDPRIPSVTVYVPVPEVERRRSHIDLVDPAHPLLPVALDCLKDRDRERPSAQELCNRLAALKDTTQYGESVQQGQRATTDGERVRIRELQVEVQERQRQLQEKDRTIATKERQLQEKDRTIVTKERQLQEKDRTIATKERQLQEKDHTNERQLHEKDCTIAARERQLQQKDHTNERQLSEKDHTIATRERQLRQLNQQLEANEQVTADFQQKHLESDKKIHDLEQRLVTKDQRIRELQQQTYDQPTAKLQVRGQSARKGPLCLHWRKCGRAPGMMSKPSCVVDGNMAYFNNYNSNGVYSYDSEKQMWSTLPQSPHSYCSLAVVRGLLTAIGGGPGRNVTNQLLSLNGKGKWVERFPPMPKKRYGTSAVCSGKSLVVAGGLGRDHKLLHTVEVMDTKTLQWSTASSLPFALRYASATICQDRIYLLGYHGSNEPTSVLACSMADLLQSCRPQSLGARLKSMTLQEVWYRVIDLPVCSSSCATLCGQLLAVGGIDDSFENITTAIHQYNPATNSWEVISHTPSARYDTLVAVLPGNKLMVVGGYKCKSGTWIGTDIVEIAALQE